ncbi:MAG: hypothetical protein ACO3PR_17460, partial [Limisphaerales bacterium]
MFGFYLNGEKIAEQVGNLPLGIFTNHSTQTYMALGSEPHTTDVNEFNGLLDGIEMYEATLGQEAILRRYTSTADQFPDITLPQLVAEAGYLELTPGSDVSLGSQVSSDAPYSISWWHNGQQIEGETGERLNLDAFDASMQGIYEQVVRNVYGSRRAQFLVTLPEANLIKNPSFEYNYNPLNPHHGAIHGWQGGSGVNRLDGPFHNQGTLIPDQHQVAFSQGGNTLSQSLQGLSPGSNYRLQFYYDA